MIEQEFRSKTASLGIEVVDVATGIHSGGAISFVHPFNGNTSQSFNEGNAFREGLAAVELSTGKWCHINHDLEPAYRARFDWVGDFHQGLAPAALGEEMFHIFRNGKFAYKKRFRHVGNFFEGLAVAQNKRGQWHHIWPNGEAAYSKRHCQISRFSEGYAVIRARHDSLAYFIDHLGSPLGFGHFQEAWPFHEGLAAVKLKDRRAFHIDHCGNRAYQAVFAEVFDFCENLAPAAKKVGTNGDSRVEYFHITRSGRPSYQDTFASVHHFHQGIALVKDFKRRTHYIDHQGKKIKFK